jgi:hypothetical protein
MKIMKTMWDRCDYGGSYGGNLAIIPVRIGTDFGLVAMDIY